MTDFLKNNPYVTKEEYLWKWTIPQVQLSSTDFSREVYIPKNKRKEDERETNKKRLTGGSIDSAEELMSAFNFKNE